MLDITAELKSLYKTDYLPYRSAPVQKTLTFTFTDPALVITNTQIVANSFSLSEPLNSSEDLVFGSCESACVKVKFANITQDLKDKTFTLTQTVNNTVIKLGTFTVDSAVKEDERRFVTITAYDNMRKFDKDVIAWYNALTLPMALKAFRQSLCTYCGVEYEDSSLPNDAMNVERTVSANTLNGLEVLRCCEAINGAFGHINRDGKLAHIVLNQSSVVETIASSSFKGDRLKYEKYSTTPIDKLQILQEDGDIGAIVGTGTNCYQIQDNMLVYGKSATALQTIATNVSANIIGVTYVPFTCELLGLPYLEVGDRVTLNNTVTSYILTREFSGIQSLTDSYEAQGNKEITQVTSVNTEVRQIRAKTNTLTQTVEETTSELKEYKEQTTGLLFSEDLMFEEDLLFNESTMEKLVIDYSSKISQTAQQLTSEINDNTNQLNSKIEQTATSINATVEDLAANTSAQFSITNTEISSKVEKDGIISAINQSAESVTINANKINLVGYVTATDLETGSITVKSNGSYGVTTIADGAVKTNYLGVSGTGSCAVISNEIVTTSDITNLTCARINGYTPINSSNFSEALSANASSLSVAYASSAGSSSVSTSCYTTYLDMSGGTLTAPGGSLYIGQNTVKANTITQTSSRKKKKHIKKYKESALDIINDAEIVTYHYKNENNSHKLHVGVILEDSNDIIVNQERSGVDLGAMVSLCWKAVQELEDRICKLELI